MSKELYRYQFQANAPMAEIEESLFLALLGAECLHGEAQVRLDAAHFLDFGKHACIIDASTAVGRDFNRLFTGFVAREFGRNAFQVKHLEPTVAEVTIPQPAAA